MKKVLIPLFSLALVFSFLFTVTGTAAALPPPPPPPAAPGLPEPVVTPVSGDMDFTTEFIPIAQFPGTTEFNQMLVPVGFPAGEAQYQGDGVVVSGMDSGKATACFYITGTQYGWGGKVGMWDGVKWVKLATTITPLEESTKSLACATITGNGTYAFIRYVVDASLLPTNKCPYEMETWFWAMPSDNIDLSIYFPNVDLPAPTLVSYEVLAYSPTGSLSGSFSGTTIGGPYWADFTRLIVDLETFDYATLHIEYPGCSTNLTWHSSDPVD